MRLLELEGKRRLAAHGIAVPLGAVWPELPPAPGGSYVVKAQIPVGGRGKSGGIVFAANAAAAAGAAEGLLERTIAGHRVRQVYIEERLAIARELYLAVVVDRDARCHALLASPDGGVDVEGVSADRVLQLPIDPLLGLQSETVEQLCAFLGIPPARRAGLAACVRALLSAAMVEDAQLVEINPLALTADGRFVAADARIVLDDNAAFRHPEWRDLSVPGDVSPVQQQVGSVGATAVAVDSALPAEGGVVSVVSGAGLMMATLDMLRTGGARVRYMIDLGPAALADPAKLRPIFDAMAALRPRVLFVNAYFQTARADAFAEALIVALGGPAGSLGPASRVIMRLQGRNAEAAARILAVSGVELHRELAPAVAAAIAAARAEPG